MHPMSLIEAGSTFPFDLGDIDNAPKFVIDPSMIDTDLLAEAHGDAGLYSRLHLLRTNQWDLSQGIATDPEAVQASTDSVAFDIEMYCMVNNLPLPNLG